MPRPTDGCCAGRHGGDRVEEPAIVSGAAGSLVERFERVEQVAAAELRPQLDERLGAREPVEAERVAEREQRAALARLERELRLELVQARAVPGSSSTCPPGDTGSG